MTNLQYRIQKNCESQRDRTLYNKFYFILALKSNFGWVYT